MNAGKCHLFVSRKKHEHMWAKKYYDQIWESRTVKLLGIVIDDEKCDEYMSNVCKKAQRKVIVLTKIDFKNTYISMNCNFYLKNFLVISSKIVLSTEYFIVELQIRK